MERKSHAGEEIASRKDPGKVGFATPIRKASKRTRSCQELLNIGGAISVTSGGKS